MIKNILLIFIGGGLGSVCRYLISEIIYLKKFDFPYPTFITNVLGCFLIGLALGWSIKNSELNSSLLILFTVGFCGGFTTFSSFSFESLSLLKSGNIVMALNYIFLSIMGGLLFAIIGYYLTNKFVQ